VTDGAEQRREARREAAVATAMALEESGAAKFLWWLSFVDPSVWVPPGEIRPGGRSFLGVCIVTAASPVGAMLVSHKLGINPGGQIATTGPFPLDTWGPQWRDRLLSATDIESMSVAVDD